MTAEQVGADSILVFNPGVTRFAGRFLMALRSDTGTVGNPHITGSDIHFASSIDGVSWKLTDWPPLSRTDIIRMLSPLEPHRDMEMEIWRGYDPRLLTIDWEGAPALVLCFAVDTTHGLRSALAVSRDGCRLGSALVRATR